MKENRKDHNKDNLKDIVFQECFMNTVCQDYAKKFNAKYKEVNDNNNSPPPHVAFLPTVVVQFKSDPDTYCECSCFMNGQYQKWNTNNEFCDAVAKVDIVPDLFSHFTWNESNGTEIVVDMQGVSVSKHFRKFLFTDPQLHTNAENIKNVKEKKRGVYHDQCDLGIEGMQKFYLGHRCTKECKLLSLKTRPIPSKYQNNLNLKYKWLKRFKRSEQQKHDFKLINDIVTSKMEELKLNLTFLIIIGVLNVLLWLEYPEHFSL